MMKIASLRSNPIRTLLLFVSMGAFSVLSLPAATPGSAVAVLHPTKGHHVSGIVHFEPTTNGKIHIIGTISGLTPNSEQAIHIHQFGDCSAPDGTSAGGHYNPGHHPHALPAKTIRHAGDLGNLKANADGVATIDREVDNITVNGTKNPIIGRGLIVHAKKDDGGQPTGNAGARVACGVIGWANPGQ